MLKNEKKLIYMMIMFLLMFLILSGCSKQDINDEDINKVKSFSTKKSNSANKKNLIATVKHLKKTASPENIKATPSFKIPVIATRRPIVTPEETGLLFETLDFLKIGLSEKEVKVNLGVPKSQTEPKIYGADGSKRQTWTYDGIELEMIYDTSNNRKIATMAITSPCKYRTSAGIGIGNSYTDVGGLYERYVSTEDSSVDKIIVGSIYGGTAFTFTNKKVSKIFVGAMAE